MTFIMLALIIGMRMAVLRRERVRASAIALWKDFIVPEPPVPIETLPRLKAMDLPGFLAVWNEVHEPLQGNTTPHLARVAEEVGLKDHLRDRLAHGSFPARLVAVIAMGHIRNADSFSRLESLIDDKNPIVSLCVARALMQIDPGRAISQFVPRIAQRNEWSAGSVATILLEAGPEQVAGELSEATLQANVDTAPRLIRFLASVSPTSAAPIIRNLLLTSDDERVISTCLQVISNPDDLDCVRPLLGHQRWHVQMQAVVTLGRLGVPGDEERLERVLSDKQWWVRYRAAQALLKLAFVSTDGLRRIQATQTDHYARDIIEHVLAEQMMIVTA
ncbi:MAG: HEAT repeat domain-containing protein [Gammaproteobacteria bacterium]